MIESFASRARSWAVLLLCLGACLVAASWSVGCGRSSLDDSLILDGGVDARPPPPDGPQPPPDAGTCNPSTCPSGCCDGAGVCRAGGDLQACGSFGIRCNDCQATGFDFCDVNTQACGRVVPFCDPKTCFDGCCEGDQCLAGTDPNECGRNGEACRQCASGGQACDTATRTCAGVQCGPGNCSGCCIGDLCVKGTDGTACGRSGQQCDNCTAQGTTCGPTFPGGVCEGNPSCSFENCSGCCAGNVCVTGTDDTSCGIKGQQCTNCRQFGEFCQDLGGPIGGTCVAQQCGPQNCKGCCSGNTCIDGTSSNSCGTFGQQCRRCGPNQQCNGGSCQGSTLCNGSNCSGCCIGDICAVGTQNTACGLTGDFCQNCAANGQSCQGGKCQITCGPGNCPGCCVGNSCVMGGSQSQCGVGGQTCQACNNNDVCSFGKCLPPPPVCDASCLGCCDPVQGCLPGFLNSSCGSLGKACANCTASGSTCNLGLSPRECRNAQTTCPATYPGCPGGVTTPTPVIQSVCSSVELQNARAACSGGPATIGCTSFFQFEQATNPNCASCLQPFDIAFQDVSGIAACVAPFVSPACNQSTGCASDCSDTSCAQCPPGNQFNQCRSDVRNNQCASFFQASSCVGTALFGAGAFCNPLNYQGNFGRWLQGVGGHYCSP